MPTYTHIHDLPIVTRQVRLDGAPLLAGDDLRNQQIDERTACEAVLTSVKGSDPQPACEYSRCNIPTTENVWEPSLTDQPDGEVPSCRGVGDPPWPQCAAVSVNLFTTTPMLGTGARLCPRESLAWSNCTACCVEGCTSDERLSQQF